MTSEHVHRQRDYDRNVAHWFYVEVRGNQTRNPNPSLRVVQCDECGASDFTHRCRQCGYLTSVKPVTQNGVQRRGDCPHCTAELRTSNPTAYVNDWENVEP